MTDRGGPPSDVLVLGAGMAGLSGARELARAGYRVTLLEARARLGGRILTEDVPGWSTPVELGAEFVHGRPRELFELIDALGLKREPSHAPHVRKGALGFAERGGDFWAEIGEAVASISLDEPDLSAAAFLASGRLSGDSAKMFAGYLEGFHAGELDRISMHSVVRQTSDDDEEQGRLREGYGRLVELLARDLEISGVRLFKKARASIVRWSPGSAVVVADDVEWRASAVLVALPLAVLKAGADGDGVSLTPEPARVRRGLDALEMGQALRVVFRLRERPGAWSALVPGSFVHGVDGEFPTFWLGPNAHETQVTAWCGGPRATRLGAVEPHSIVREATRSLAAALDLPLEATTDLVLGAHVHAFGEDPFSRGAYPYAVVGKDAAGAFEPVEATLFFAGDYTVPEELGTVGVAVRSGVAAAREIQGALGSPSKRR